MLWLAAIAGSAYAVVEYQYTPGVGARPPAQFSGDERIKLSPDRNTLIMLAHPLCPCTDASVNELSAMLARNSDKLKTYVLFLSPSTPPSDWDAHSRLRQKVERIQGVTVLEDIDGKAARQFNAMTSGQTFVYSPSGALLFNGGITAARGQIGDNTGIRSLISTLESRPAEAHTALVFGCPLSTPEH